MDHKPSTFPKNAKRNGDIRRLKALGVAVAEIAAIYELSVVQVYRITNKRNPI